MPIYEYACDKCGAEFEEVVFDEKNPSCPSCGSGQTHKLMSACARRCKNSGAMDYAPPSGGGCSGCSGGNCASCGH